MTDGTPSHPPAWLPDGHGNLRWWDGTRWTDHLVPNHPMAQSVGPPQVVADTKRRVLAFLIDMALMIPGFLVVIVGVVQLFTMPTREFENDDLPRGFILYFVGYGIAIVTTFVNRAVVQGLTGLTLGKKIMRLRLVRIDGGRPPGFWWGLLRWILESAVGIIDIVLGFVTDKRQRTGDMAAKTIVLNEEDVDRVTGRAGTVV